MTDREKLIELLQKNEMDFMLYLDDVATRAINGDAYDRIMDRLNFTANYLIAHGVTVREPGAVDSDGRDRRVEMLCMRRRACML